MPILEFDCTLCNTSFEKLFPFSEVHVDTTSPCPSCGASVQRVLYSKTLEPLMYGSPDGYGRPAKSLRHSYKHINSWGNTTRPGR